MNKIKWLIILPGVLLIPQVSWANAGTALMWMPVLQMLFGNILIGVVEGLAVALLFKLKWVRSVLIMIGANYASWILGNTLVFWGQELLVDSLFRLKGVFVAWIFSLVGLYLMTVVVEWPFVNLIFAKEKRNRNRSLKVAGIINVFSYSAMILLYLSVSKYSLFTELEVNQSLLKKNYPFELYLERDGEIISGTVADPFLGQRVYQIPKDHPDDRIFLKENEKSGNVDLLCGKKYLNSNQVIVESFIAADDKVYYPVLTDSYSLVDVDFRDPAIRHWKVSGGGWAVQGLTIDQGNEVAMNYAFEVPWMFWAFREVAILSDDELLCYIGGRVILLNKNSQEIAYVTRADHYTIRRLQ
ncbi:hypothetical protein [Mangrovibacterium sp.]|uniref:hypothetical protein n=1 Tax=Mangrovibacterium sp. TaxID=1961364 RepID=UPI0035671AAC